MGGTSPRTSSAAPRRQTAARRRPSRTQAGKDVPYLHLARTLEAVSETTKRLEITAMCVTAFRAVLATTPADLLPAVYLLCGELAPAHEGLDLGVGDATLIKALAEATGRSEAAVKELSREAGDLGTVAVASRSNQRTLTQPQPLTVRGVYDAFRAIGALAQHSGRCCAPALPRCGRGAALPSDRPHGPHRAVP